MLAAIAEFERELIRERSAEGRRAGHGRWRQVRRAAGAHGVPEGRGPQAREAGEPLSLIVQAYRVSVSTIARL